MLLLLVQFQFGATKVSGFGKAVYVLLMLNRTLVIVSPAVLLLVTRKVIGLFVVPMMRTTVAGVCATVNERAASAAPGMKQIAHPMLMINSVLHIIFLIQLFI